MISYAITDPSTFNVYHPESYLNSVAGKADMLLYRDKNSPNYSESATFFIERAYSYPFKKILHGDYKLALQLKADGVHLRSDQLNEIIHAKKAGCFVIASTHSEEELQKAVENGVDMVTFSPVFHSPGKGEPKGVNTLKKMVEKFSIPIIALGGIVGKDEIEAVEKAGAVGFASIRYFA